MLRKVLFPTDFSEGAFIATERFAETNQLEIGELILFHAIDYEKINEYLYGYSILYDEDGKLITEVEEKLKSEAEKKLKVEKERLEKLLKLKNVGILLTIGTPYKEILKVAEKENVSLILLPSHGNLSFTHEIFGSTTYRVLKKTKKAVLLIKTHKE